MNQKTTKTEITLRLEPLEMEKLIESVTTFQELSESNLNDEVLSQLTKKVRASIFLGKFDSHSEVEESTEYVSFSGNKKDLPIRLIVSKSDLSIVSRDNEREFEINNDVLSQLSEIGFESIYSA